MGMQGGPTGRADFLALGDYNAVCSMCGRKRKASELEKNWQGLYRCPWHNEPRQPQDFVRNVKDIMTVPWAQPEVDFFQGPELTFPLSITPNPIILIGTADNIQSETSPELLISEGSAPVLGTGGGLALITGSGVELAVAGGGVNTGQLIVTETGGSYSGIALCLFPSWVTAESILWSWASGGAGITLTNTTSLEVSMTASNENDFGVLQCTVTSTLGAVATATVNVGASSGALVLGTGSGLAIVTGSGLEIGT